MQLRLPMTLPRDRELLHLFFSATAVLIGLLWMFYGLETVARLVESHNQAVFYYFFSGIIFSLAALGLYGFLRTVLYFTEFMAERNSLNTLMYENLLNDEHDGVFLKNHRGVYKIMTPVAVKVLHLENKQVLGSTDKELHNTATTTRITHEDKQVLEFGETITWETTIKSHKKLESYLCKKIPCYDRKGKIVGIIGICKNITNLKHSQNQNQQLEARYQNLFNKLPYPVLVLDPVSLQPFTFNDAMNHFLGYEKEEFSRMRMSLHIEPAHLEIFQKTITDLHTTGGGEFETSMVTKQRDILDISGYSQEIIIEDKCYLHMLLYDTTEQNKSTEVLISSELKYRSLFEHANDAIIIVSPNTLNIIDANEIAIIFLGYKRDDLLLMSIHDLDISADHSFTQDKLSNLETYNHTLYEHQIKTRYGETFKVEINAHKLNYGDQDVYQFVIRNISMRKKTEAALKASEKRYRKMFESNMAIKLVIDPENFCIEDANPAAEKFYGYSIDILKGMNLAKINILSREKLNTLIQQTREQNLGFYSCPHRLSNGEVRFVEVRDGPMEIEGKQLFYSIIHDVTASKEAENQVLVASKMFDYSTDAVMLINDNNQVVSVNYAFTQITGYQQSEIQNASPELILAGENDILLNHEVLNSIDETGQWNGEIWHRLKSGQSKPLSVRINCIRNENTNASSYVVLLTPKSNQSTKEDHKLHYVELTQLPNRLLFIDRLQNAIDRATRNKKRLGIILIDFKNFSDINAQYGYDMGDRLLQAIAKRLKYNTRDSDTVSHFSSDNFAILIEDLSDIQHIGIVSQKLLSTLSESYQTTDDIIDLNLSMGISIFPDDGRDAEQLINQSKTALVTAQNYSGNHFELTSAEMNRCANLSLNTETHLHKALRNDQFFLSYLPQINTDNNTINSIEALIRWDHPDHGAILPIQFLAGAEQTGFIGTIGKTIIRLALSQYREWLDSGLNIPRLDLNISQTQLDNELIETLTIECKNYNIPHQCIGLELSEFSLINSTSDEVLILQNLQELQFFITVDNFGSSNSSFTSLLQCMVSSIKLDPRFITKSQSSPEAQNLLKGIVSLCNTQNILIIAEGIETETDYEYLRCLDITHMQGYLFGQPLLADEVTDYISNFKH